MGKSENGVIWCDGCGVEITWGALVRAGTGPLGKRYYCCQDCLEGRPCRCGERLELQDEHRTEASGNLNIHNQINAAYGWQLVP